MARGQRGHVKKIDNLVWDGFNVFFNSVGAGTVAQGFDTVSTMPFTFLRIRGEFLAMIEGAASPGVGVNVAIGIIKVPEGSGTTVQYDPVTDINAPWWYYDTATLLYTEYEAAVVGSTEAAMVRRVIDNKSMRRVRPDEEMQIVLTNTTFDAAGTVNVGFAGRHLKGF